MEVQKKTRGRKLKSQTDLTQIYKINEDDTEETKERKQKIIDAGFVKTQKSKQDKISIRQIEKTMKEEGKNILLDKNINKIEEIIPLGSRVLYLTNDKPSKFRYGGVLTSINNNEKYFTLKGMRGITFSVQFSNIKKIFYSMPDERITKKTSYAIFIDEELYKQGNKRKDLEEHINTKKFQDINKDKKIDLKKVITLTNPKTKEIKVSYE